MNKNKALEVMLTEKCCVERQEDISKCDRRCGECDLLLPTEEVLQAYDFVINMLKRPKGKWIFDVECWDNHAWFRCSECHAMERMEIDNLTANFCWKCGAEMRGDKDETISL